MELLVSCAIVAIIAAVVIVRNNAFDSTVLLKSFAYEIAVALREAQIYSLSVINTGSGAGAGFRYPYGLSFTPSALGYTFFRFNNTSTALTPRFETGETTVLTNVAIPRGMQIYDVCVTNNGTDDCSITRLDISFRRPEFAALFYAPPLNGASTITSGKIYLRSLQNVNQTWIVEITLLGQIIVRKQ